MKDFVMYVILLVSFSIATWLDRGDATAYYINDLMKKDLLQKAWRMGDGTETWKTFYDIANVGETWSFISIPLLAFLLRETGDNGEPIGATKRYYPHNSLLLGIRLRTVRMQRGCVDTGLGQFVDKTCYAAWNSFYEEKEPYGPNLQYSWADDEQYFENAYYAQLGFYTGNGYAIDLPLNYTEARATVQQLRENNFIDDAVRAVFIDFQLYNDANDLHIACRMVLELPHIGGVKPKATFNVLKFNKYDGALGILLTCIEGLIGLFTLYYFIMEIREMRELGWRQYFRQFWNVVDIINLTIFIVVGLSRIYHHFSLPTLDPVLSSPKYQSLQMLVNAFTIESCLLSVNAMLLWLKLMKFMSGNKKIFVIARSFIKAGGELFFFVIMFLAFLLAFAHFGYCVFYETSGDFRSFSFAVASTFLGVTNGLDKSEIIENYAIAGPLFSFCYQFLVMIVLMNVFLAIINSAYDEVTDEDKDEDGVGIIKSIFSGCLKRFRLVKPGTPPPESPVPPSVKRAHTVEEIEEKMLGERLTKFFAIEKELRQLMAESAEAAALIKRG